MTNALSSTRGIVLGLLATAGSGCGMHGSALHADTVGTVNGREVSVGFVERPDMEQGYLAWLHRDGSQWRLEKVEPAWSVEASKPVPVGRERLYVLPRKNGSYLVSPIFTEWKMYDDPSAGRLELFACGKNWPHTPGNTPCESNFAKNHWTPEGLAGGQRNLDRDAIVAAVEQARVIDGVLARQTEEKAADSRSANTQRFVSSVHPRVTRVLDEIGIITISPEAAATMASVRPEGGDMVEGAPAKFAIAFADIVRSTPTGDVSCALKPKGDSYTLPFHANGGPTTIELEAIVTGCRVSNPHPASFVASDRALTARLEKFRPDEASAINLSNESSEYVTVSAVTSYYFEKVNQVSNLTIEIPPRANKTFDLPLWNTASVALDGSTNSPKRFRFGLAIKYKKGAAGEATLLHEEEFPIRPAQ
jgi:hypothetical protein